MIESCQIFGSQELIFVPVSLDRWFVLFINIVIPIRVALGIIVVLA